MRPVPFQFPVTQVVESIYECAENSHVEKCLQEQETSEKRVDLPLRQEIRLDFPVGYWFPSGTEGVKLCPSPSHKCVDETVGKCRCDKQRTGEKDWIDKQLALGEQWLEWVACSESPYSDDRYLSERRNSQCDPEWSIDHGDFSSPVEEGYYCEDEHEDSRDYSSRYEGLQALGPDECVETGEVPFWKSDLRQLIRIITHSHFAWEESAQNQNHSSNC